jgi:hypothetical protein
MQEIDMDARYAPSGDIVARVIEGELIIVPLVAGIGDMDDEIFSVNEIGKVIWAKLDGKTSLAQVIQSLADNYSVSSEEIERDVRGFVAELLRRKMIVDARTTRASS